ncbi:MAG: alpha/beta hydrolase fold domain-containing protein, partial [bacterium]|nr:alpha/beta hydrolase fold domain-containing protein [bacterium]
HHARVVVGGDSAGGNLAAAVAQQRGGHPGLVGQVLVYPATDPTLGYPSAMEIVEGPFLTRRDMEWFYDQYVPGASDRSSMLVDLVGDFHVRAIEPTPAIVLTVGHDPLRDEGVAYAQLLADIGTPVTWLHAPELFHGAFSQSGFLRSAAARVDEVWSTAHRMFS